MNTPASSRPDRAPDLGVMREDLRDRRRVSERSARSPRSAPSFPTPKAVASTPTGVSQDLRFELRPGPGTNWSTAIHPEDRQRVLAGWRQAARFRGYPKAIRTDQGPEFTGRALDQWAYRNGVQLKLIQAGKPTQNAFIESFNGRFRDECLNDHWFTKLPEARILISAWRRDYNQDRQHSALGYQTPAELAARHRSSGSDKATGNECL